MHKTIWLLFFLLSISSVCVCFDMRVECFWSFIVTRSVSCVSSSFFRLPMAFRAGKASVSHLKHIFLIALISSISFTHSNISPYSIYLLAASSFWCWNLCVFFLFWASFSFWNFAVNVVSRQPVLDFNIHPHARKDKLK